MVICSFISKDYQPMYKCIHRNMQPSSTCDEIERDRAKKNYLNTEKIYGIFLKKEQYKFHTTNSMLFEGLKCQTAQ